MLATVVTNQRKLKQLATPRWLSNFLGDGDDDDGDDYDYYDIYESVS